MSFSLNISGHVADAEEAKVVDALVRSAGEALVASLAEHEVSGLSAEFAGPTGAAPLSDGYHQARAAKADADEAGG